MDIAQIGPSLPPSLPAAVPQPAQAPAPQATLGTEQAKTAEEAARSEKEASPPSKEKLDAAVQDVRDFIENFASLDFSVDDDTGRTIVKLVDSETKEVIRQIPSQEMLEISKALDGLKGLFVHQQA